nr:hypothetical protein [Aquicoccus sp. G2-2]MEA1112590.1 hypothetical protein [Aquicoccus sp. G2-2]
MAQLLWQPAAGRRRVARTTVVHPCAMPGQNRVKMTTDTTKGGRNVPGSPEGQAHV